MTFIKGIIRSIQSDGFRSTLVKARTYIGNRAPIYFWTFPGLKDLARAYAVQEIQRLAVKENEWTEALVTANSFKAVGPYASIKPLQNREEHLALLREVRSASPDVVVEIGTARGGSLYGWARGVQSASTIISIDLKNHLRRRFLEAFPSQADIHAISGDSCSREVLREVESILDGKEIDFLFIDGDHSYEGVARDFQSYLPLVRKGGLIAFDDIVERDDRPHFEVHRFWEQISKVAPTKEIVLDEKTGGIGIVEKVDDIGSLAPHPEDSPA